MSKPQIIQTVTDLLDKHYITTPPVNPEAIAEGEGIDVVFAKFSGKSQSEVHGFFHPTENKIYVNVDDNVREKLFTIAHELGHHFLHRESLEQGQLIPRLRVNLDPSEIEKQADEFASLLLAPPSMVKTYSEVASPDQLSDLFLVDVALVSHAR